MSKRVNNSKGGRKKARQRRKHSERPNSIYMMGVAISRTAQSKPRKNWNKHP